MKRWLLITMILTLLLTTVAHAQSWTPEPRKDRWDFSIMTRYSWSMEHTDDNGSKLDLDSDLGWGFGFSKYVKENFNLGLTFSWHSSYYTATAVGGEGNEGETHTYSNVLSTSAIALYGDYMFGSGKFQPYLTGNMAWARANTNVTADIDGGCYYYPYVGYVCGAWQSETYGDDSFAYSLGLGLRMSLSASAFIKVGYEHTWTGFDAFDTNDILRVDLGFQL